MRLPKYPQFPLYHLLDNGMRMNRAHKETIQLNLRPLLAGLITGLLASQTASAHFQMLHIDDYMRTKGGKITLKMPFTHPSHGGPMMDMGTSALLDVTYKGKTTDLTDKLTPVTWQGTKSKAAAYTAETKLRGMGDYIFSLTPEPYLETSEDTYIQQFTKTIVNVGGLPTGIALVCACLRNAVQNVAWFALSCWRKDAMSTYGVCHSCGRPQYAPTFAVHNIFAGASPSTKA